jgi:muconate cycloisomerase
MPDHKSLLKVVELVKKRRIFFVKAKVGDRRSGVETLHVLRSELGPQANIRVDANGAFSAWEALTFLAEVEPFTISALEQPVPKHELAALGEVSRRSGVPVFADESLCTLQDAAYLIENDLCTGFNLRLTKCGGFLRSLAMRDLARRHGVIWQLGCHVGETAILSAAGRHMAALGGDCAYLEGSFSRYVLREDLSVEDLTFGPGGLAPLLSGPGLGVTIDDSTLSRWSEPVVSLPQR